MTTTYTSTDYRRNENTGTRRLKRKSRCRKRMMMGVHVQLDTGTTTRQGGVGGYEDVPRPKV